MNAALRPKKEGRRRASAQLLLPWVDEMPNTYTRDAHTVNTQRWIFDGHLMASREAWGNGRGAANARTKGVAYLMGI